ncbi:hypothetical protein [Methylobacterium komagatae]
MAPNIRTVIFHSDDGADEAVVNRVLRYLDSEQRGGDILLITQQCFWELPYFKYKGDWKILIDEDIKSFDCQTLNLHHSHQIITDYTELDQSGSLYARLIVNDGSHMKTIVDNKNNDDVWRGFRAVCALLIADDQTCYVNVQQYNDLKHGLKPKGQLSVFSLRNPERLKGFESVTIASAWFDDSLTYHNWKSEGVEWIEDEEITRSVLRPNHPFNDKLTIYYGYEGRNSKALRDRLEREGNTELRDKIREVMGGEPFVWLENKDRMDRSALNQSEQGAPLPPISAGLNEFSHYRNAVVLAATNYTPAQADFLVRVADFDKHKQARAMVGNLYQAFMRTALRNDEIEEEARWVVACREEAELLSERFPGCIVKELGLTPVTKGKAGRPRKHENDNARKRAHERRKKELSTLRVDFVQALAPVIVEKVVFLDEQDETTYNTIGDFVRYYQGSYFNNWKDTSPKVICRKEDKFIDMLKDMYSQAHTQKDDIPCITGALFDPSIGRGGYRNQKNVIMTRGIWIDIEGGDLDVVDFERVFPQLQFVAYSTYSHTKEAPRFRIYIPTDRIMTEDDSVSIYQEIRAVLKSQGWKQGQRAKAKLLARVDDRFDGIDNRSGPSQLSILPCQSKDRKASFFIDRTGGKKPLNVDAWLNQRSWMGENDNFFGVEPYNSNEATNELTIKQLSDVDDAMDRWNRVGTLEGRGDSEMLRLYLSLRRARLPYNEIAYRLESAASNSRSPKDRKDQARRLIRQMR